MYYPPASPPRHEDHNKYGTGIPMPTTPTGVTVHHQHQHATAQPALPQMHYSPYPMPPSAHSRTRRWSSGLCHCCDDPANCLITAVCPCITFGQVAEIVDKGSTSCANSGTMYVLIGLTGFACLFSCFYRSKMRAQYDLEEEPFADCLVHFCCETCALCQEYRELKTKGFDMGIGWESNIDRQRRGVMVAPGVVPGMAR